MTWNWQQPEWPRFSYASNALESLEERFLLQAGEFMGAFKHVGADERNALRIELISEEAVKTSEIEGEVLNRESVQSSLRRQLGLGPEQPGIRPAERGIAEMMVDLYEHFAAPLAEETLFTWHRFLLSGATAVGGYRTHEDAMQVVSGLIHKPTVHFEAPPSKVVPEEMQRFITWFNDTAPEGSKALPALTRAGLAHLYFVSIHPFEDGNGRVGRALAEKSLAQNLRYPSLILLAHTIAHKRKHYYAALKRNNKDMEVTDWLTYFARTILDAQSTTIKRVDFSVAKAKFHERLRGQLNERQAKVVARMFKEGIDGFQGGLSAENYIAITETSRATATRDLHDLVAKGALTRTGELRYTRYALQLGMT